VNSIRVLQCGLPKSGNYWIFKIIKECFQKAELNRSSFIQNHPIYEVAQNWELSHSEQADIDVIDITDRGCFYRISSIFRHPVTDIDSYLEQTNHVWTHSSLCDTSRNVLPKFDKIVYIVRDPRDAALSHARFVLTPYMKTYFPNDFESKQEYLEEWLEGKLTLWVQHVAPYIAYANEFDIHVIFYERFLNDFAGELDRLVEYLGITLTQHERRSVEEAVTFESMKEENPDHVQKGKAGKWREQMTPEQKRRSRLIAGPMLRELNYPLHDTAEEICPSVPEIFTSDQAEQIIENAKYPSFKDKLRKNLRAAYRTVFF